LEDETEFSVGAVETCSILTTTPNALTTAVHDRMPVILDPDGYDLWLDPGMKDVAAVSELRRIETTSGTQASGEKLI